MEVDPITFALYEDEDNGTGQTYGDEYEDQTDDFGDELIRVGFLSDADLKFMRSKSPYQEKYPESAVLDDFEDD